MQCAKLCQRYTKWHSVFGTPLYFCLKLLRFNFYYRTDSAIYPDNRIGRPVFGDGARCQAPGNILWEHFIWRAIAALNCALQRPETCLFALPPSR